MPENVQTKRRVNRHLPQGVTIIHEDRDILVVEKPSGLLTVGTERIRTNTLYYKLTDYVRKGNAKSRARIFIVHRLDRDASGLLVLAKTPQAKRTLQDAWDHAKKTYVAVVHGTLDPPKGMISNYLMETDGGRVLSARDKRKGKLAHTAYTVLKSSGRYSLVEIDLLTGRKHQIRVHFAEHGNPIVGDTKYGTGDKQERRLALHAAGLAFNHPYNGKKCEFTSKTPGYFAELMRREVVPPQKGEFPHAEDSKRAKHPKRAKHSKPTADNGKAPRRKYSRIPPPKRRD